MTASIQHANERPPDPSTVFGCRLRQARIRRGLSQGGLGVRIGLDEGTAAPRISRYESGVHAPQFSMAARMAKELLVPVAYLYCPEDELAALMLGWCEAKARLRDLESGHLHDLHRAKQDHLHPQEKTRLGRSLRSGLLHQTGSEASP